MNRWAVFVLAYLLVGLELGARPALALGPTGVAPSFLIPFLVFIAMFAPPLPTLWTALILGAVVDLTAVQPTADGRDVLTVLGPHALGFVAAAYLVLTMRGLMVRKNPLSLVFLAVLGSLLTHLVVVAFFTLRSFYDDSLAWSPVSELTRRALSSLYTGLAALVMAWVLLKIAPLFSFQDPHGRGFARRTT